MCLGPKRHKFLGLRAAVHRRWGLASALRKQTHEIYSLTIIVLPFLYSPGSADSSY